ncbi:MAG: vitamin K epoxide reductase family protein [Bacteroidota bacterium]
MEKLLHQLLVRNGYSRYSEHQIHGQLHSHPEFPSLRAITDSLDYFNIENLALSIPKESWGELPSGFMAQIHSTEEGEAFVRVEKKGQNVRYFTDKGKRHQSTVDEFSEIWTGIIVAVDEQSKVRSRLRVPLVPTLGVLAILGIWWLNNAEQLHWVSALYFALSFLGLGVAYTLGKESYAESTWLGQRICGGGQNTATSSCSQVLNSSQSKLPFGLTLTDLAIGYFGALVLAQLAFGFGGGPLTLLTWASLPVILLSWGAQALVLRKWCALCLTLSLVMLAQWALLFAMPQGGEWLVPTYWGGLAAAAVVAALVWRHQRSAMQLRKSLHKQEISLLAFKRDPALRDFLIAQNPQVTYAPLANYQMLFGTENTPNSITSVINPLCGYCSDTFKVYRQLIEEGRFDMQLRMIFLVPDDPKHEAYVLARRMIACFLLSSDYGWKALVAWFDGGEKDSWLEQFPAESAKEEEAMVWLKEHRQWCVDRTLMYTPITFLGDVLLDLPYHTEDLPLLLQVTATYDPQAEEFAEPAPVAEA